MSEMSRTLWEEVLEHAEKEVYVALAHFQDAVEHAPSGAEVAALRRRLLDLSKRVDAQVNIAGARHERICAEMGRAS